MLRKLAFIAFAFNQMAYGFRCLEPAGTVDGAARTYLEFLAALEDAVPRMPHFLPRAFHEVYSYEESKALTPVEAVFRSFGLEPQCTHLKGWRRNLMLEVLRFHNIKVGQNQGICPDGGAARPTLRYSGLRADHAGEHTRIAVSQFAEDSGHNLTKHVDPVKGSPSLWVIISDPWYNVGLRVPRQFHTKRQSPPCEKTLRD